MTSKHEPHEQMILSRLSRGISYRQIAQDLTAHGCKTDAAAVYRWVKSRAARIASRASLIDPLAASGTYQVSPNAGVVKSHDSPKVVGAASTKAPADPGYERLGERIKGDLLARESSDRVSSSQAKVSDAAAMQTLDALIEQSASAKSLLKKK